MIHFFANRPEPLSDFIDTWAGELTPHVRVLSYNRIPFLKASPRGAYIFSDFERLRSWKFSQAKKLCRRLRSLSPGPIVLNDPHSYVGRFPLLRRLRERGTNEFQVHRVHESDSAIRFPVFLRSEVDHRGPISGLLHSRAEIDKALTRLSFRNFFRKKHLMLVEYCDCADAQGVFRKYSAMNINGLLIPRHVLFSRDWVTKKPDLVSDPSVDEEVQFVEQFPHREKLAEIFQLAGMDYGRIDYGVKDGRIQVWEINTNPVVIPPRQQVDPRRMPSQNRSAQLIVESMLKLARS